MGEYHRITVEIGGQTLVLRTQNDPKYVRELAEYVDGKIQILAVNNPRLSISQLALLTAINLADEIHGNRQERPRREKKKG